MSAAHNDVQVAEIVPTTIGRYVRAKLLRPALLTAALSATLAASAPARAQGGDQTSHAKLSLFNNGLVACKIILLDNNQLATSFVGSGAGSVSSVCECASLLTASAISEEQAQHLDDPAVMRPITEGLRRNVAYCSSLG